MISELRAHTSPIPSKSSRACVRMGDAPPELDDAPGEELSVNDGLLPVVDEREFCDAGVLVVHMANMTHAC